MRACMQAHKQFGSDELIVQNCCCCSPGLAATQAPKGEGQGAAASCQAHLRVRVSSYGSTKWRALRGAPVGRVPSPYAHKGYA